MYYSLYLFRKVTVGHPTPESPHDVATCFVCTSVKKNAPALSIAKKLSPAETYVFEDEKSKQEFAAKVIREKLVLEASTSRGTRYGTVTLASGGPPICVEVKPPNSLPTAQAKSADFIKFMQECGLSMSQMLRYEKFIRGVFGRGALEPRVHEKIIESSHEFDDFFDVATMEFELKEKNKDATLVKRPVVYVQDAKDFIQNLHGKMSLDMEKTFLKVGIDNGQGFLKMCLLIVNKESNVFANSVKEVEILAVVPDVQESYKNVKILWDKINMNELSTLISADLKMDNIILGIQSHSSSCPCYICDAKNPREKGVDWPKGTARTLGNIRENYDLWSKAGSHPKKAKDFKSCTNLPMFQDENDDDIPTIQLVPPCELHLLLGPVNHMVDELRSIWPEVDDWVAGMHAFLRGQDHGKLNGNGCNKLLKEESLIHLENVIPDEHSNFAKAFSALAKVVHGCYSYKVADTIKEDIDNFRKTYLKLQITVTPKVHIILDHLYEFLEDTAAANNGVWVGLAMYSEQAFESVHSDFKKRWQHFKVNFKNESYGEILKRAVCCYNSIKPLEK